MPYELMSHISLWQTSAASIVSGRATSVQVSYRNDALAVRQLIEGRSVGEDGLKHTNGPADIAERALVRLENAASRIFAAVGKCELGHGSRLECAGPCTCAKELKACRLLICTAHALQSMEGI